MLIFGRQTKGEAISRGMRLFKLLVRVIVGFVLAVLLIVVAAKAWIIPGIIRHKAEQRLSRFCEGRVAIENVEIKQSGQVALERIRFLDKGEHEWLMVDKARAVLVNWPSLNPAVQEIAVDGLNLKLSVLEGEVIWPRVRWPQRPARAGRPGIQKIAINRGAVTVVDAEGASTVYGDLTLSILQMGAGQYEFSLDRITGDSSELLLARGGVNVRSSSFDFLMQMKHRFTRTEMALPLAALGLPAVSAEGSLFADFSMTGSLKKPEQWRPKGTVRLRDWVVAENGAVAWSSLGTDLEVSPAGLGFANISISDSNDVEWFGAGRARLTLANWPGRKPAVTQIELEGPKLRTTIADGRTFRIPAWLPKGRAADPNAGPSSLQRLVVRDATIAVQDANGPQVVFDRLWVDATRQAGDSYDITAARRGPNDSNAIALKGLVDPASSQVGLSLKVDYSADKQETEIAFAAMGTPQYALEGRLVADLALAGHLNKPSELQADGSAKLDGCTLFFREGTLADKLAATATFRGRRLDIEQFDAAMCKGRVSGYFHADVNENQRTEVRGRVLAVNVNFPEFVSVLTTKAQDATTGVFTASYDFTAQRNGTGALNGEGLMFFDDADVSVLPGIPQIFASAGLSQYELLRMSDAEAAFKTSGYVVTIESGHISNNFAAIEFEPGGTIDLRTRQIDGYVVAAPLSQIAGAVESLPIIKIFARIKDKLMRLHVKGDWRDPPGKLITKEPVKDLKESTVGFLQDVVKGGGQLGRGMIDRLGGLFKSNEKKGK
jgi:hypothetical protein